MMWCVENEPFEEFACIEDFKDSKEFSPGGSYTLRFD